MRRVPKNYNILQISYEKQSLIVDVEGAGGGHGDVVDFDPHPAAVVDIVQWKTVDPTHEGEAVGPWVEIKSALNMVNYALNECPIT